MRPTTRRSSAVRDEWLSSKQMPATPKPGLHPDISVTIRLPDYRDQLMQQIGSHVADLTQALRSLEEGTFSEQAMKKGQSQVFHVTYSNLDIQRGAEQRHIEKCFRAVIASFITYLDQMIAMQRLSVEGIPIEKVLEQHEALEYVQGQIQHAITVVATDRSLTNPKKIESFLGLRQWSKDAALSLFALRRCYEHHGGVAESDFTIRYGATRIFGGDQEIGSLPFMLHAGQGLSLRRIEKEIDVKAGKPVQLTEQEFRDIVFTIEVLGLEILEIASRIVPSANA
jgi:hypothetical protein